MARTARSNSAWARPTTYLQRFGDAMALLCNGERPPDEILQGWLHDEDDTLQAFAIEHGPAWAQGLVLIDAARLLADTPTEGVAHEATWVPSAG